MKADRYLTWCGALGAVYLTFLLGGCDTVSYYSQAIRGQTEIWRSTRPIDEVIADPQVTSELKHRLALAQRIRDFASRELGLPDNASYRGYADLKRPYVVWNVFAAQPLSVKPRQWCFPVAGCVAYKGFFAREQAQAFAEELKQQGYDVFLSGIPAYSTLGYFDDPLLNTFVHYPPADLARLIFHELAHQVAYARDDSVFNESFAVAVEREGVKRWLMRHGAEGEPARFEQAYQRREAFYALMMRYRDKLEVLYGSAATDENKLEAKAALYKALMRDYRELKASWGGFKGYDAWLGGRINNATLASIAVYTQALPFFERMLAALDFDLPRFYAQVRKLADQPKDERLRRLSLEGKSPTDDPSKGAN
jgi:predicted aminopeptidase